MCEHLNIEQDFIRNDDSIPLSVTLTVNKRKVRLFFIKFYSAYCSSKHFIL